MDALGGTRFVDVRRRDVVTSTNDEVAALAAAGAADATVVVADWQSAGRGRRGRQWQAPAGSSLLVSVLLRPSGPAAPHLAVVAAGLAAASAASEATGAEVVLKWPNDVVAPSGSKLGGILSKARAGGVVVGLGLNVDWPVPVPAGGTTLAALATPGRPVDREAVLVSYLRALDHRLAQPPAMLMAAYRRSCSTIGRTVRVELARGTVEGMATGVDDDGRLVVGGQVIAVGDVVHLR